MLSDDNIIGDDGNEGSPFSMKDKFKLFDIDDEDDGGDMNAPLLKGEVKSIRVDKDGDEENDNEIVCDDDFDGDGVDFTGDKH